MSGHDGKSWRNESMGRTAEHRKVKTKLNSRHTLRPRILIFRGGKFFGYAKYLFKEMRDEYFAAQPGS